jgi:hypothetical protein
MSGSESLNLDHTAAFSAAMASAEEVIVDVASYTAKETDGWDTVLLPGSLDVDALEEGEPIDLVTSLEQQNQTLRDRVGFLETALEQSQTQMRSELERWESLAMSEDESLRQKEQSIAQYMEDITVAQEKITQLFQDLEQSHRNTQRQQILNETLTIQIRSSQERQAQLERDCAQTQQRYIEQSQLVLRQEHQCRDLQARLHRQQRYTLQYKAAVEKCLEVPTTAPATTLSALAEGVGPHGALTKQVTIPKPQPVQPWSAPEGETIDLSHQAWLNAFLSDSDQFPTDTAVTNLDWQAESIGTQPVSFDLEESLESPNQRLDAWVEANHAPSPSLTADVNQAPAPSPFITLAPLSAIDLSEAGEVPVRKRESLAAVDLPMFVPIDATLKVAVASVATEAKS